MFEKRRKSKEGHLLPSLNTLLAWLTVFFISVIILGEISVHVNSATQNVVWSELLVTSMD